METLEALEKVISIKKAMMYSWDYEPQIEELEEISTLDDTEIQSLITDIEEAQSTGELIIIANVLHKSI